MIKSLVGGAALLFQFGLDAAPVRHEAVAGEYTAVGTSPRGIAGQPVYFKGYPCTYPGILTGTALYDGIPVRQALDEINAFRALNGLPPLQPDRELAQVAEMHLHDLARRDVLSHYGANGSTLADRLEGQGYDFQAAGENLAGGYDTYHAAIHGWIDSPGHRANLLRPNVSRIGLAAVSSHGARYHGFRAMVLAEPASPRRRVAALTVDADGRGRSQSVP